MIDLKIKFTATHKGRQVRPEDLPKLVEADLVHDLKQRVNDTARRVRCPVHNKTGRVTVSGTSLKTFKATVDGCCDKLKQALEAALK